MNPHVELSSPNPPAFPQVLYIGRLGSAELIAALRRDGVDVIVAFDSDRGAQLLNHVQPQAILCAAADATAVLAYAEPKVHVIVLGHEGWVRTHPATTVISSTLQAADVAHRVRQDIARRERPSWVAGA
jgi:precorrin-6x reductase